jgi:hypothetical protein
MTMNKILKELGYPNKIIEALPDSKKKFLIDNNEIMPRIKKQICDKYPNIPEDETLVSIIMSLSNYEGDFFTVVRDIIKKEERDFKITKILGESKIYKFSDFNKLS